MQLPYFFLGIAFTICTIASGLLFVGRTRLHWLVDNMNPAGEPWYPFLCAWMLLGAAWLWRNAK